MRVSECESVLVRVSECECVKLCEKISVCEREGGEWVSENACKCERSM